MRLKSYTHSNLNTPIIVDLDMLFSFYFSQSHQATLLMASGGAMIPVKETVEQITMDKQEKEQPK